MPRKLTRALASLSAIALARAVSAQTVNWTAGSGDWNVAGNWTPATVPISGVSAALVTADAINRDVNFISASPTNLNFVNVDASGSGRVTLWQAQDTLGAATFSLGTATTQFGSFNLSGGTFAPAAQIVGSSGNGTIAHSGGLNQSWGFLSLGDNTSGAGTYLLSGSAVVNLPEIYVGYSGTGTLAQNGGQILGPANSFLALGYNANSNGTLLLNAGTIGTQFSYIGAMGNGTVAQNGGVLSAPQFISIGDSTTGRGSYRLTNGILSANQIDVGYSGYGTFTQTGGTTNITGPLSIATNPAARGTLTLSSGTFSALSTKVGANGTIYFNGGAMSLGALTVSGRVSSGSGFGKALVASSVALSDSGMIDLNDSDMIVRGGNSYSDITTKIRAARNAGSWNGVGITSTAAKNDAPKNKMLGVMRGSEFRSIDANHTRFDGITVANSDILIRYTYYGDANFNGRVDGGDYARIDSAFTNQGTGSIGGWINGDFNLDGRIDGSDYALMDAAYLGQSGVIGGSIPAGRAVPEPTSAVILPILTIATLTRRARKPL